jgi:hypothetical protein
LTLGPLRTADIVAHAAYLIITSDAQSEVVLAAQTSFRAPHNSSRDQS